MRSLIYVVTVEIELFEQIRTHAFSALLLGVNRWKRMVAAINLSLLIRQQFFTLHAGPKVWSGRISVLFAFTKLTEPQPPPRHTDRNRNVFDLHENLQSTVESLATIAGDGSSGSGGCSCCCVHDRPMMTTTMMMIIMWMIVMMIKMLTSDCDQRPFCFLFIHSSLAPLALGNDTKKFAMNIFASICFFWIYIDSKQYVGYKNLILFDPNKSSN